MAIQKPTVSLPGSENRNTLWDIREKLWFSVYCRIFKRPDNKYIWNFLKEYQVVQQYECIRSSEVERWAGNWSLRISYRNTGRVGATYTRMSNVSCKGKKEKLQNNCWRSSLVSVSKLQQYSWAPAVSLCYFQVQSQSSVSSITSLERPARQEPSTRRGRLCAVGGRAGGHGLFKSDSEARRASGLRASGSLGSQDSGAARLHPWLAYPPAPQPLWCQSASAGTRSVWRADDLMREPRMREHSRKGEKGLSRRTCNKHGPVAGTSGGDMLGLDVLRIWVCPQAAGCDAHGAMSAIMTVQTPVGRQPCGSRGGSEGAKVYCKINFTVRIIMKDVPQSVRGY